MTSESAITGTTAESMASGDEKEGLGAREQILSARLVYDLVFPRCWATERSKVDDLVNWCGSVSSRGRSIRVYTVLLME